MHFCWNQIAINCVISCMGRSINVAIAHRLLQCQKMSRVLIVSRRFGLCTDQCLISAVWELPTQHVVSCRNIPGYIACKCPMAGMADSATGSWYLALWEVWESLNSRRSLCNFSVLSNFWRNIYYSQLFSFGLWFTGGWEWREKHLW